VRRRRLSWSGERAVPDDRIESVCCRGRGCEQDRRHSRRRSEARTHLEELEVGLAEAVEDELDLEEEVVGAELGPPAAEDRVGGLEDGVVDDKVVGRELGRELLRDEGERRQHGQVDARWGGEEGEASARQ